jgi:isopenicillin N synthase-like dioxygenase
MTIFERPLVTISLANYESRKDELVSQITAVAEESGFFAPTGHGIPESDITTMFTKSESFFSLPTPVKSKYPFERTKAHPLFFPVV